MEKLPSPAAGQARLSPPKLVRRTAPRLETRRNFPPGFAFKLDSANRSIPAPSQSVPHDGCDSGIPGLGPIRHRRRKRPRMTAWLPVPRRTGGTVSSRPLSRNAGSGSHRGDGGSRNTACCRSSLRFSISPAPTVAWQQAKAGWHPVTHRRTKGNMRIVSPSRTLWSTCAGQPPEYSRLAESMDADVAVVGAGYLGLSTALHLAEDGARVTVLEARMPGHGASGETADLLFRALSRP